MQPNNGGDGSNMGPTGEEPIEKAAPIAGETSSTSEELNLKIEQELGLPHTEVKTDDTTTDEDTSSGAETDEVEESGESEENESDSEEDTEEVEPLKPTLPSDEELFIEVEDADGVTHKISKVEDLPEDFTPKNNRQILDIVSRLGKLDVQREAQELAAATAAEETEKAIAQADQMAAWDKEVDALVKEKRLSAADNDKVNDVLKYMAEINRARTKAGNPNLVYSFEDGLDKYEASQAKRDAADKEKQDNNRAKVKASLIGGTSSAATGEYKPYVSGSARSMDDIVI